MCSRLSQMRTENYRKNIIVLDFLEHTVLLIIKAKDKKRLF